MDGGNTDALQIAISCLLTLYRAKSKDYISIRKNVLEFLFSSFKPRSGSFITKGERENSLLMAFWQMKKPDGERKWKGSKGGETEECKNYSLASLKHIIRASGVGWGVGGGERDFRAAAEP